MTTVKTEKSLRHGTVRRGLLQLTIQPITKLPEFADTSVPAVITAKTVSAFQIQKIMLHAQGCRQMLSGTLFQASHRHGTEPAGHRLIQEATIRPQTRTNADTNAKAHITGIIPNARVRATMSLAKKWQILHISALRHHGIIMYADATTAIPGPGKNA